MPNTSDDNTDFPRLPLDDDALELLDGLVAIAEDPESPHPALSHEQMLAEAVRAGERHAYGVGRQMRRDLAQIARFRAQAELVAQQTEQAIAPLVRRVEEAKAFLGRMALMQREASGDRVKTYVLPGVIEVPTKQSSGRWAIDNDAARDALMQRQDAETKEFVERVPAKVEYKLKGPELRKHLDQLVADALEALPAGLSASERAAQELHIRGSVAAAYPGVQYVPPDLTVDFKPLGD